MTTDAQNQSNTIGLAGAISGDYEKMYEKERERERQDRNTTGQQHNKLNIFGAVLASRPSITVEEAADAAVAAYKKICA